MRTLTRTQTLVRSFFGLGVDQLEMDNVVVPVLELDQLLRGQDEVRGIAATSAAIAVGASGNVSVIPPDDGPWQLLWYAAMTTGPATSGTFRFHVSPIYGASGWNVANVLGIGFALPVHTDPATIYTRTGQAAIIGARVEPPIPMFRRSATLTDSVFCSGDNIAGAVGTMTLSCLALFRQLQRVGRILG